MKLTPRPATVREVNVGALTVYAVLADSGEAVALHWTSFWSTYPGQGLEPGQRIIVMYDGDRVLGFKRSTVSAAQEQTLIDDARNELARRYAERNTCWPIVVLDDQPIEEMPS